MTKNIDDLLGDILSSVIQAPADTRSGATRGRSVLWCLQHPSILHTEPLAAAGIWMLLDGSLFFSCHIMKRTILAGTLWRYVNINRILQGAPGAKKLRVKRKRKLFQGICFKKPEIIYDRVPGRIS